jgi:hypothetical protein
MDEATKSSIETMYATYVDAIGLTAITSFNASQGSTSNFTLSTANMILKVVSLKPMNTISSLSSQPPHQLSISSSSLGVRRLSVFDRNIPMVLSVARSILYDTVDTMSDVPYYKVTSNPLRLQVDCSLMNKTQVQLVLYHSASQSYDTIMSITKPIQTVCHQSHKARYSYMCEYSDRSTYNVSVGCDGSKNVTYTTTCPSRLRKDTKNARYCASVFGKRPPVG